MEVNIPQMISKLYVQRNVSNLSTLFPIHHNRMMLHKEGTLLWLKVLDACVRLASYLMSFALKHFLQHIYKIGCQLVHYIRRHLMRHGMEASQVSMF
jgi:hypothetical protein